MTQQPTNKVVGVSFDESQAAPTVILKGSGAEADALVAQARASGDIAIVKDPQLVRQLYRVPLDEPIGRELFPVMAALLAHIIQLDRQQAESTGGTRG
jgi:flagellar biosynthesis protein